MIDENKTVDTNNTDSTVEEEKSNVETPSEEAKKSDETLLGGELSSEDGKEDSKEGEEDSKEASNDSEDGEKSQSKKVPEKYDIKVPEGMEIDTGALDLFSPVFKELELSQEGVQKLIDVYAPYVSSQVEASQKKSIEDFNRISEEWKSETEKELGADKDKKLALCSKALNKFGSKELRTLLTETGVGNNKELVNFMIKIGSFISEDSLIDSDTTKSTPKDVARTMYPSMKK